MQKLKDLLGLLLALIVTYGLFIEMWGVHQIAIWFALPFMIAELLCYLSLGERKCSKK